MANFPLKALERLVVWKMDTDLLKAPIHDMQHGFTKEKSTESAISNTANRSNSNYTITDTAWACSWI